MLKGFLLFICLPIIIFTGVMGFEPYKLSNKIDDSQNYYESFRNYSYFKQKMDGVLYSDEMFKKDLTTYHIIYDNRGPLISYTFLPFMQGKIYFNSNPEYVKKYFSYYNDSKEKDFKSFIKSNAHDEQKEYFKNTFNSEKEKINRYLSFFKMVNYEYRQTYINDNIQKYLAEKGLPVNMFGLSKEQDDYVKQNRLDKNKMNVFQRNTDNIFISYTEKASDEDLKKIFKAINAFYVLTGNINSDIADEYSVLFKDTLTAKIKREIFYKIEIVKEKINKKGKIEKVDIYGNVNHNIASDDREICLYSINRR